MNRDETLAARDGGTFTAYVAVPAAATRAPGLLLMQYISGVNRVMRRLADEFAAAGFLVACPDLFWRQQPNVQINNDPSTPDPAEHKRALELNAGFGDEAGVRDLIVTLDYLRRHARCSGRVGGLGYCLGGRLAFLMAARSDIDCAVGYYGVNIQAYLDEAPAVRRPLLLHMAEQDELCPPETRERIIAALASRSEVTTQVYAAVRHAFALERGANYAPAAAELANRRSLEFLRRHLGERS